jgi:hypothetical protein
MQAKDPEPQTSRQGERGEVTARASRSLSLQLDPHCARKYELSLLMYVHQLQRDQQENTIVNEGKFVIDQSQFSQSS